MKKIDKLGKVETDGESGIVRVSDFLVTDVGQKHAPLPGEAKPAVKASKTKSSTEKKED